ncbi:MAG: hypothetical protein QG597_4000 [Actinomycetota bacterium]|nr:hypothetical protein [Actinomycetota bacterium]
MDQDKIMPVVVLGSVFYTWGVRNRGWTSPLGFMKGGGSRMNRPRSEEISSPPEGEDADFMNPEGEDDGPDVEKVDPGGILLRSGTVSRTVLVDSRYGPGGKHALTFTDSDEDEDEDEQEGVLPDRRVWVAKQMWAKRRPTEIDRDGARLYGVTERTIASDRAILKQQGVEG